MIRNTHRRSLLVALAIASSVSATTLLIQVAWNTGYAAGLGNASSRVSAQVQDGRSVVGKITSISGTTITIETLTPERSVREMTITTDTNTIFHRVVPKDPKDYQDEVAAFAKIKTTASTSSSSEILDFKNIPLPFTYAPIKITDLYIGQTIGIEVMEEVTSTNQFTAMKVTLSPTLQQ